MFTVPTAFHQHFTLNRVLFKLAHRAVFPARRHAELSSFYTRRLVGRFPASSHTMSGDPAPAFFVSSLPAAHGPAFSHPSVLMHLPPFHGHADATVSTI
jgi:hypothetical protein